MSSKLSALIGKLKEQEASKPQQVVRDAIIFWGTGEDRSYLHSLKGCVGSVTVHLRLDKIETLTQVKIICTQKKVNRVASTSVELLKRLLHWDKRAAPSLDNYAGSYFIIPGSDIEVVFLKPLKQLATVPYGKFMATRIISKLIDKERWYQPTSFTGFTVLHVGNEQLYYNDFQTANLIAVDIETFQENAVIRCVSYTAFFYQEITQKFHSISVSLPLDSIENLYIMRKWNQLTPPKVLQNGKYDISYFARYSAPLYNYLYDTATLFHSWYSELPKDLGFLNAFFIREAVYWKDLSNTSDLYEYYKYNCLDTWGTGNAFLAMVGEAPQWAITNYLASFPLTFPCHMAEMIGIERDMERLEGARKVQQEVVDKHTASLNKILGVPAGQSFNVASPPQVKSVLKILGCSDLKSTSDIDLKKARFRHPFNGRIVNLITETRKARKLISTYITPGKEFHRLDGTGNRILFALNPHGTDTSRLASTEHHFWCGLQIQNIPRDGPVKTTLKADDGFLLCEVDLEQAESRDTAYISGDKALIQNVEYSPDFHCANASAFFGIPFDQLYDVVNHVKLNLPIRQIAKNVNHGASYNMGPYVLIDTMGEENILKAKKLLGLPKFWTLKQVAEYLLDQFHRTYPSIRAVFYEGVIQEVRNTHMLTSRAVHHCTSEPSYYALISQGTWTRYCFSNPEKSKQALNRYVAHPPQSLNAQTLNRAYLNVFDNIAMNPEHSSNFKLGPQIHDSILFQHRIGHDYLAQKVKEAMEIPVTIKGYDGIVRTFTVPAAIKSSGTHWSDLK